MSAALQSLKASVDLRMLVAETHELDHNGMVRCPNPGHEDVHPSCHIRAQSFKCFACGCSGDAIDWYELVHDCTTGEAIQALKVLVGEKAGSPQRQKKDRGKPGTTFRPVPTSTLLRHNRDAATLSRLPKAVAGRGFTLEDLKQLGFAASGDNAIFPIPGPDGNVLALKCRYSVKKEGMRYGYITKGHGSPAWCSPDFMAKSRVLVIEGELNAMICSIAAPHLAFMGVAGTNGPIHAEALTGKEVYVYADGDDPGQKARERWCRQALEARASTVFALEPWPADACDIAGGQGLAALRERLT